MTVLPHSLFKGLNKFSFAGIAMPCRERAQRFQQGLIQQEIVDGKFRNVTVNCPENDVFSFKIPASEYFAKGPYKQLYTKVLREFIAACRLSAFTPATLVDPERGEVLAKCSSVEALLSYQNQSGEDLSVDFVESPELGKDPVRLQGRAALSQAVDLAGALDAQIAAVPVPPDAERPKPFVNPLRQINGLAQQGLQTQARIGSRVDDVSASIQELEDTQKEASDPERIAINRSMRNLRSTLRDSQIVQDPVRVVRNITVAASVTVSSVAANAGMSIAELLQLNPALARNPKVPAGSSVLVLK